MPLIPTVSTVNTYTVKIEHTVSTANTYTVNTELTVYATNYLYRQYRIYLTVITVSTYVILRT